MKRRWWVLSLVASIGLGCASSTPVDCPEGWTLTEDGLDCEITPVTVRGDGGMGGMGGGGTGGAGPLTCDELDCDDGNECTTDGCDDDSCVHTAVEDDALCMLDRVVGRCKAGACVDCSVEDCRPVYPCTEQGIREAIADGGDVVIGCDTPTTVTLTEGVLEIENDLNLDGLGNLTIDADEQSRVLITSPPAIVELVGIGITGGVTPPTESTGGVAVRGGSQLTLRGCRIFGNAASKHCGGLGNSGVVTIIDSELTENLAGNRGGALCNNEDMTIIDSVIRGNRALDDGGAIYNTSDGVVLFERTTIIGNEASSHGGGIWTSGTSLTVKDSMVTENHSDGGGGGIRVWKADLEVIGSVVARNTTGAEGGGALKGFAARMKVQQSVVTQNSTTDGRGGAVFSEEGSVLEIFDSELSENVAGWGGGVYSARATARLFRTAVVSNEALGFGGGFRILARGPSDHDLILENCSVSDNDGGERGGGIASHQSLQRIMHTTIANNRALVGSAIQQQKETVTEVGYSVIHDGCVNTVDAPFNSLGYNALLDLGEDTCALSGTESDLVLSSAEIGLGPLADNGGFTPTLLPDPGSLLVDAIPPEACDVNVTEDQRGQIRGNGSPCDIGAVERQVDD